MPNYVRIPYLPYRRTKSCLVSSEAISVINDLSSLNIEIFSVPPCASLQKEIATHPDMICCPIGNNHIIIHPYHNTFIDYLTHLGFHIIPTSILPKSQYPMDISLNAVVLGDYLIGHTSHIAPELQNLFPPQKILSVKQGYTKCNTLILNQNSIITSDAGIALLAKKINIDVLKITPGHISLQGFAYGFIGGCGGMLDKSTLYLSGALNSHPDCNHIRSFLQKKGISLIEGSSPYLLDIGSIVPLTEI